jgi:hypothetical protein
MLVSRNDFIFATVLLFLWLLVSIPRLHAPIDLRWDGSTYFVLGTAIAEKKGYRLLNEPGEIEAVQYPPLLPLIVAAHERLLGSKDYIKVGYALRYFYCIISGVYVIGIYVVSRKLLSPMYSMLAGVITIFSFYSFLHPSGALYADLPFALLSILFLLCSGRANPTAYTVLQGVFSCAAYLLRTAGIALLVAWVLEAVLRKPLRHAIIRATVALIPILLWQLHVHRVTTSTEYRQPTYPYQRAAYYYSNVTYHENASLRSPFRPELGWITTKEVLVRTARNALVIPKSLGESAFLPVSFGASFVYELHRRFGLFLPRSWKALSLRVLAVVLTVAGLLAIVGGIVVARSTQWPLSLVFGCTIGLVIITPWQDQFWRYLAAVAPLTVSFVIVTLFVIRNWLANGVLRNRAVLCGLSTFLPLAAMISIEVMTAAPMLNETTFATYYDQTGTKRWKALYLAFDWLRANANPKGIIATTVPHLAYIITGHRAVLPPMELNPDAASHLLDEVPVSYLVLDQLGTPGISEHYAAAVITHAPQDWRLVFKTPDSLTEVYERIR